MIQNTFFIYFPADIRGIVWILVSENNNIIDQVMFCVSKYLQRLQVLLHTKIQELMIIQKTFQHKNTVLPSQILKRLVIETVQVSGTLKSCFSFEIIWIRSNRSIDDQICLISFLRSKNNSSSHTQVPSTYLLEFSAFQCSASLSTLLYILRFQGWFRACFFGKLF